MANRQSRVVDTGVIWCGDNLDKLRQIPDECVDVIYIDPPFNAVCPIQINQLSA